MPWLAPSHWKRLPTVPVPAYVFLADVFTRGAPYGCLCTAMQVVKEEKALQQPPRLGKQKFEDLPVQVGVHG